MNLRTPLFLLLSWLTVTGLDAQLIFNEVLPAGVESNYNPVTGEAGDWIELYNNTGGAIDLGAYHLSDRLDDPFKWNFPASTYIDQGGYAFIWADNTDTAVNAEYGLHCNFALSALGETIYLFNNGTLIDSMLYPACEGDISYGISTDGSHLYFGTPTPGDANNDASAFLYSGEVSISPAAGRYNSAQTVSITATGNGTIRYSLDGSEPTVNSPIYLNPLSVGQTTVLRARLFEEGFAPGRIATATYLLNEVLTFPAVSLVTEPANFFDDEIGIYVTGTNGRLGYCEKETPRNYNQAWERPIHVDFMNEDGSLGVQLDGGTKIHGGCSRGNPLKSLALFARARYGTDQMDYQFFPDKEATWYKTIILRNSGNDYQYTMFRDAMIQTSVKDLNIYYQAYKPVEVYMNGEYWGLHNLREKVNEHYVKTNFDIDQDEIDFMKNNWEVFAGTRDHWDSMQVFMAEKHFGDEANYKAFGEMLDIDAYTDYLITHMFYANRDWPGNNQKSFRHRDGDGKWRYIIFDIDFTMGLYNSPANLDMFAHVTQNEHDSWPNARWSTEIMRSLFENEGYVEQFLQRYQALLNTTFAPERIVGLIDEFAAVYEPFMPGIIEQWGPSWRSMDRWYSEVQVIRDFAIVRPDLVRENMRNFFGLGDEITVSIEAHDSWNRVKLNTLEVPVEGASSTYMGGVNVKLECDVDPGYIFSHWEVTKEQFSEEVIVPALSEWSYLDGGNVPASAEWTTVSYDDGAWASGPGILGYGGNGETTTLSYGTDSENKALSYYFRHSFTTDITTADTLKVRLIRDDGAIVYLNGQEVVRSNMPEGAANDTTTSITWVSAEDETRYFEFRIDPSLLVEGENMLAVQLHQSSITSSDVSFDLELIAMTGGESSTETYTDATLSLDPGSGISVKVFSEVFEVDAGAEIYINEFMASSDSARSDWLELYNAGDYDLDLGGYYLSDRESEPARWQIPFGYPDSTTIKAGSYLVFHNDKKTELGPMHTGFRLNAGGEFIGLAALSGQRTYWIDSHSFDAQAIDTAMGRYPDGSDIWEFMEPSTPGDSNQIKIITEPVDTSGTDTTNVGLAYQEPVQLDIFPNPVGEQLSIRLKDPSSGQESARVVLMDLGGRVLVQGRIDGMGGRYTGTLDVSRLPRGIYVLQVESGGKLYSKKVIRSGG